MDIKYVLYLLSFKKDGDPYGARIRHNGSLDVDGIIQYADQNGGWPAPLALVRAIVMQLFATEEDLLAQGYRLNTPTGQLHLVLKAGFKDENEPLDADKHILRICSTVPAATQGRIRKRAIYKRVEGQERRPTLRSVQDTGSGKRNSVLTRGGSAMLRGSFLKFDPKDKQQGIFLVSDQQEYRVSRTAINRPKCLVFPVPGNLPEGDYELHVRARVPNTRSIRCGKFKSTVRVVERDVGNGEEEADP